MPSNRTQLPVCRPTILQCESATHSLRVYPFLSCFHLDYERPHQRFNSLCVFCTICCSGSRTLASAALSLPITVSRNVDKPLRLLRKPFHQRLLQVRGRVEKTGPVGSRLN